MKKKNVISWKSLPMRSPVNFTVLHWLLLEHIRAPEWAYGVLWTVVAILVTGFIASFFIETSRDVRGFGDASP